MGIVRDWTSWIVPRVNENNLPDGNRGGKKLRTTDMVSIRSVDEIVRTLDIGIIKKLWYKRKLSNITSEGVEYAELVKTASDFAISSGSGAVTASKTFDGKRAKSYMLRSAFYGDTIMEINSHGTMQPSSVGTTGRALCPSITLQLPSHLSVDEVSEQIGEIRAVRGEDGEILYHTIDVGEYPQTKVPQDLNDKLEAMFNGGQL
jgi:hypothetical protein